VSAGPDGADAVAGPTVSFGFNLAKVPDHGEDADPILRDGPDLGLAAVFDGMGGAGGTVYDTPDGSRSGAYLASRIARRVVEEHLLGLLTPDRPLPGEATATELHDALEGALQDALAALHAPASRLRSRLLRALPTTMALGALQRAEPDGADWICHVLWAGDSRVYACTADGLQQLSIDDLRDAGDAMTNLQRDSVISNAISADTDFRINHRRVPLRAPFVLVCATDGCFGYLRSPMHFEAMLLRTLMDAGSEEGWSTALQEEIAAVTGDDASLVAIGVGADVPALQRLLGPRLAEVEQRYTGPMDDLVEEVHRAEQALADLQHRRTADTAQRWARYRPAYERLLQRDAEPAEETPEDGSRRQIWNPPKPIATGVATADDTATGGAAAASTEGEDAP
jgi:serine/threonine protein phosphatase PrpC